VRSACESVRRIGIIAKLALAWWDGRLKALVAPILLYNWPARLFSLPPKRAHVKEHEEATRNYEQVKANIDCGNDVLRGFCQRTRAEAGP
jgi:hypothetical protein